MICYYISFKDHDRKKVWEKIGWKSEGYSAQVAYQMRADRMQALRHGEPVRKKEKAKNGLTFDESWQLYEEKWMPNLSRPQDERSRCKNHVAPRFADVPLGEIKNLSVNKGFCSLARREQNPLFTDKFLKSHKSSGVEKIPVLWANGDN